MAEDDPRRADLRRIIDETRRCKIIVADLLNFARQQEVLAQETDLNRLLEQAIEAVQHQPTFGGVHIVRQLAGELPPLRQIRPFAAGFRRPAERRQPCRTTAVIRPPDRVKTLLRPASPTPAAASPQAGRIFTPSSHQGARMTGHGLSIVYGIIKMRARSPRRKWVRPPYRALPLQLARAEHPAG
jgi:two-component system NtrC family sensor kinase